MTILRVLSVPLNANRSRLAICLFFSIVLMLASLAVLATPEAEVTFRQQTRPAIKPVVQQAQPSKPGKVVPTSPNPYLSFLPVETTPDYTAWQSKMNLTARQRMLQRSIAAQATVAQQFVIVQGEVEPVGVKGLNDSVGTAEAVPGFGTGAGDDAEADISGNLKSAAAPVAFTPLAEDEGDILKASNTLLANDQSRMASATIGDGSFGSAEMTILTPGSDVEDDGELAGANVTGLTAESFYTADGEIGGAAAQSSTGTGTGDFDLYRFSVTGATTVVVNVYRRSPDVTFRPILGIYDGAGNLVGSFNDQFIPGDIQLTADFAAGTWYVAVGGNRSGSGDPAGDFLADATNSDSGPGAGSEGLYSLDLTSPTSGDFDFYRIDATVNDVIDIEVDTDPYFGELDPIVAIYSAAGVLLAFNDDGANGSGTQPFDSHLTTVIPATGPYYVAVGGFSSFPTTASSFLADPMDSSSGPGFGSEGDYDIIVARNIRDSDTFSFNLDVGDIIAANVSGSAEITMLLDDNGAILHGSFIDVSGIFPPSSAMPGGGNASMAYIVTQAGNYNVAVTSGEGPYALQLRAFRPPQEATGTKQRLFLDFDGETLDTTIWGPSGFPAATLSPLSAFLANWGLTPGDESALIDAIIAEVRQALETDIRNNGLNSTFDIEILNSRDHADPFGDPDVSRIIIGGTIAESGIDTIGIAESIDIGNYDLSETSLVLLDLLSDPSPSNPNSLNQFSVDPSSSKIALVAAGVGNVASHEAGHFFANFHTINFNATANLMDTGGNLPGTVGVGPDMTFGTGDDENVVFVVDDYDDSEGFFGSEDTKNHIAFGLTTGPASNLPLHVALPDINSDGIEDIAVMREGSILAEIRSGSNGALQRTIEFFTEFPATAIAAAALPDSDGNGIAELAVLASRDSDSRIVVEVRNLSGAQLPRYIFFAANHTPVAIAVVDDDADNNGVVELAVLSTRNSDGRMLVEVKNAFGATNPKALWYMAGNTPVDLEVVPDKDANGIPEIAVLSSRISDGRIVTELKNAAGASLPSAVWFMPGNTAIDLVAVDDKDANGIPEVAVLSSRNSNGRNVVEIKNAVGATNATAVWFIAGFTATDVAHIHDADNNGVPEVAVLSVRDSDGRIVVEVKNVIGATNANSMWYSPGFTARGLATIDDSDSNGVEEALVMMIRDSDGRIVVEGRNAAGNPAPKQYWFSP